MKNPAGERNARKGEGPRCRRCRATEAACARAAGCCTENGGCTHWRYWSADGELVGPDALLDEVTLRRRERERERSRQRYAAKKSAS